MTEILFSTINARYIHTSLGLRYPFANFGALKSRREIRKFENSDSAK